MLAFRVAWLCKSYTYGKWQRNDPSYYFAMTMIMYIHQSHSVLGPGKKIRQSIRRVHQSVIISRSANAKLDILSIFRRHLNVVLLHLFLHFIFPFFIMLMCLYMLWMCTLNNLIQMKILNDIKLARRKLINYFDVSSWIDFFHQNHRAEKIRKKETEKWTFLFRNQCQLYKVETKFLLLLTVGFVECH